MHLKSLYLRNFRNYKEAQISFSPKLNFIYGDNAAGKTNLLEAIHLIATGRSFRTEVLKELIREGETFFFLEAILVKDDVLQKVQVSFDGENKKVVLGANSYPSFHPLLGILPIVLCTPYDIELITGSPAERRKFLNLHLAQSDPLYVHHLTRFWRAMKQRNCLLRAKNANSIECWEAEMAHAAHYIAKAREEMVSGIKIDDLCSEKHEIQLQPSASKTYLQQLQKNRSREMELGVTLTGPHRDDLHILIQGKMARLFASEGQKKTVIAALKLAEWNLLSQRVGNLPLLGFDDLESSLDHERQRLLNAKFMGLGQVFITTPHKPQSEGHSIHISPENNS